MLRRDQGLRCATCGIRCDELCDDVARQVAFFAGQSEYIPGVCLRNSHQEFVGTDMPSPEVPHGILFRVHLVPQC